MENYEALGFDIESEPANDWESLGFEIEKPAPKISSIRDKARTAKRAAKVAGVGAVSGAAGWLGDLLQLLGLQSQEIPEAAETRYRLAEEAAPEYQWLHGIIPTLGRIPTSQDIRELAQVEPESALERVISRGAELAGAGALGGLGAAGAAGLGGLLAQTGREQGLPEALATTTELATPLGLQALLKGAGSRLAPALKNLGLTEKQVAPVKLQRPEAAIIRAVGKPSTSKAILAKSKAGIDNAFAQVAEHAQEAGEIGVASRNSMLGELGDFLKKKKSSSYLTGDSKKVIQIAEEVQKDLMHGEPSADRLINAYRNINQEVNWESPKTARKALSEVNKIISDGLKEFPELHAEFVETNKLLSNFYNVQRMLGQKGLSKLADLGEGYELIKGVLTLDPVTVGATIGTDISRRAFTRYLLSPRGNNITQRLASAIKRGSTANINALQNQVEKDLLKEAEE